jgi:multiple sugar transport system substrate-binding protein
MTDVIFEGGLTMKKKALLFLVLLLAVSLILSAGGKKEDAATPVDEGKPLSGTTLHVIAEQQSPTMAMQKQIPKFEELTGIKVILEMGPMDNVVSKEILALESGSGAYDLISTPYQFLGQFVTNGYLQPLDPLFERRDLELEGFDRNDLIAGMVSASGEWKGVNYGIPSNTCIMVMFYRKDLFNNADEKTAFKAKYGYDLAVPTDWDQYYDMAEFFTRKAGEKLAGETLKTDFYGTSIAGKRHDAMTCEWLNYAWSFGGGVFDDSGRLIMNSPENKAALDYFLGLIPFSPPGVSNNTWDELTTQMQQGIVAMQVQWNDCAPAVEDPEASKVAGKVGYTAIPQKMAPAAHYGAWTYFIPATAKNPEAAWLFLQWVNTTEVQKQIALEGGFPCLTSVYEDPELEEQLPYWEGSLEAYNISSKRPRIPEWNEMNNAMMLQLSRAITGEISSGEALNNLQKEYEELLSGQLPISYQ